MYVYSTFAGHLFQRVSVDQNSTDPTKKLELGD